MSQIIIVSNRLPVSVKKNEAGELEFYPSSGGLATGLSSYTQNRNSKWIGWPGMVSDDLTDTEMQFITKELHKKHCYPVFLTRKQLDAYYNGYSNSVLWPQFHNLPADISDTTKQWKAYREVNQRFCDIVITLTRPKSTIWIHDYQLLLLPRMLRKERPSETIGFFLHIPFPLPETFAKLPQAKSLLRGMLGADLIGFHTAVYTNTFLDNCFELNVGIPSAGHVILENRAVKVAEFPMGIDYAKFAQATNSHAVKQEVKVLKKQYRRYKIILTVDRLDPTKGLVERLQAYQEFLKRNPHLHKKVKMVMLAVPSRTDIAAYQALKERVEALVERINNTYGGKNWQPVHYMYTTVSFERLTAMYQIADVAFIAPIRDGMNLVAKEYVASKTRKGGVLILSETAGAAQELEGAIIVNPLRRQALVNSLSRAVTMPRRELKKRVSDMQQQLSSHTVHTWVGGFVKTLQDTTPGKVLRTRTITPKLQRKLREDYQAATSRLLLLDYDGVISPFVSRPEKAFPNPRLLKLLSSLGNDPANHVVLLSGRNKADMDAWFGELPVTLAAEHGMLIKPLGQTWRQLVAVPRGWKKIFLPVLQKHADLTPGAFVEEKDSSLVWHYRKSPPYYAQKNVVVLKSALKPILKTYGLKLFSGNKILEIKSPAANKGLALGNWLTGHHDFVLAIGDDYTDEDMFNALPIDAYSIKVGRGRTNAKYRLKSVDDVLSLLKRFG